MTLPKAVNKGPTTDTKLQEIYEMGKNSQEFPQRSLGGYKNMKEMRSLTKRVSECSGEAR